MGKIVYFDVDLPDDLVERGREAAARIGMTLEEWIVALMKATVAQREAVKGDGGDEL